MTISKPSAEDRVVFLFVAEDHQPRLDTTVTHYVPHAAVQDCSIVSVKTACEIPIGRMLQYLAAEWTISCPDCLAYRAAERLAAEK